MGRHVSGQIFIGVFYTAKTSAIIVIMGLFGNVFLCNVVNGGLMKLYSNFRHITTVFLSQSHNKYLWIELETQKLVIKVLNLKNYVLLLMFVIGLFYKIFSVRGDAWSLFIKLDMLISILLYNFIKNPTFLFSMYQNYLNITHTR